MMHCTNILTHQLIFLRRLAFCSLSLYFGTYFFLQYIFSFSQEIGVLRQQILASEGELRSVSSPAYTAKDRDKAVAEQSVSSSDHFIFWHCFSWLTTINLLSCGRCSKECVVLLLAFLLLCCCFLDFFLSLSLSDNFLYSPHWHHPVTQRDLSDPEWTVEMAVSNPHVDTLCRPAERESRGSSPKSQHLVNE